MRRYMDRIASDPIRRALYLATHRLRRQRKEATKHDTRPGHRKESAIQLKNETNVKFLDHYEQIIKQPDQYSKRGEVKLHDWSRLLWTDFHAVS